MYLYQYQRSISTTLTCEMVNTGDAQTAEAAYKNAVDALQLQARKLAPRFRQPSRAGPVRVTTAKPAGSITCTLQIRLHQNEQLALPGQKRFQ